MGKVMNAECGVQSGELERQRLRLEAGNLSGKAWAKRGRLALVRRARQSPGWQYSVVYIKSPKHLDFTKFPVRQGPLAQRTAAYL